MSDTSAKAVRAAREAKAKRLGSAGDPKQKVDASTWTPPEMMNTEAKTGLRPVSRRQFKSGGKVGMMAEGSCGAPRADRKPRKAGGSAKADVDAKINRNVKEANAELGKPHVGGMKHGGRMKRADGGNADPRVLAAQSNVPSTRMGFQAVKSRVGQMVGLKKGGKVGAMEWEHSKADLEQDKKLAKKHGMKMEAWEKSKLDEKHDKQQSAKGLARGGQPDMPVVDMEVVGRRMPRRPMRREMSADALNAREQDRIKSGASIEDTYKPGAGHYKRGGKAKAEGGEINYTGGTRPTGGREARAYGGGLFGDKKKSTKGGKGKTNIVISINAGGQQPGAMPPRPPQAMPVPVPPPPPPGGAGGPPMPMPPPGGGGMPPMPMPPPGGPGGPAGMMPPMGRKAGGRIYPKMHAGAGGGEGRLEKIDAYGLKPPR